MDGLCAGVAAIAALAFCYGTGSAGETTAIAGAIAGAAAGFLLYNFHPARIFMGDSGSLLLGSTLGMLTLHVGEGHTMSAISALVFPVILLTIPLFDTMFVTVSRKLSARAASLGGRDHTSHRLVALGFPERQAVLLLYGFAAVSGATAVLLGRSAIQDATLLTVLLLVALVLLGVRLARVNVYGDADFVLLRSRSFTPLLIDVTYKRRLFEVVLDAILIAFAYYAACVLRFDTDLPRYYPLFLQSLPIVIACQLAGLYAAGVYQGIWRYISVLDLWDFGKGLLYGALLSVLALVYLYRFQGYSRAVFVIDVLLLGVLVIGSRVAFRALGELAHRYRAAGRKVAVYGAGDAGLLLVRELRSNSSHGCRPVMFVDDDPQTHGKRVLGVPVAGGEAALSAALAKGTIEAVAIASSLPEDRIARITRLCRDAGAELLKWQVTLVPVQVTFDGERHATPATVTPAS
jgi:UDP-GlcNAc:undecaprenyl-phosphate GlcNAc-1-phosphate transferase